MNQENHVPASPEDPGDTGLLSLSPPIPPKEIENLCRALAAETDRTRQLVYWKLLEQSAPSSKALDFALDTVMNPSAPNRGEAVRYLRICFPDRLPGLLDAFARDPDEEMRYQLSEFLRDSDVEAAVGMKIGLLHNASAPRQEVLIKEIAELGNLWHLEGLHGLANLSGGDSVFARAAELLEKRTKTSAAGAG